MKKLQLIFLTSTFLLLNTQTVFSKEAKTIITIGSGSAHAMYYPVASAICQIFNKYNQNPQVSCKAVLSEGAEHNLNAVENGELTMGISQKNLQYDAFVGNNNFQKPHRNLRTIANLHYEYLTILAKNTSNINSFSDLKNKSVNIGNVGSGSRILFEEMAKTMGWSLNDFSATYDESGSDINKVLCKNHKADAAVYIVGHPNKSFNAVLKNCDVKLVSLSKAEIFNFIKVAPKDFIQKSIPQNTYESVKNPINTFAVKTVLSVSKNLDAEIVANFIKILSEHKSELIKIQPSLQEASFDNIDSRVPIHEGLNY